MTEFDNWRDNDGRPLTQPDLSTKYPPRTTPSLTDQSGQSLGEWSGSSVGSQTQYLDISGLAPNKPDGTFFAGPSGRAIITVRVSSMQKEDIGKIAELVWSNGVIMGFQAHTQIYPVMRTVLILPTKDQAGIEGLVRLTDGNLQEFIDSAMQSNRIELHIFKAGENGSFSAGCRADRLRQVLLQATEALRSLPHSADGQLIQRAYLAIQREFSDPRDGFQPEELVRLKPVDQPSPFIEITFSASSDSDTRSQPSGEDMDTHTSSVEGSGTAVGWFKRWILRRTGASLSNRTGVEETARRVAALVDAQERRYGQLTEEQRRLSTNWQHLDQLVSSGKRPKRWIRDMVEVRAIGYRLDREGGKDLMEAVAYRAAALSQDRGALPVIEMYWDGIGDWLA